MKQTPFGIETFALHAVGSLLVAWPADLVT